MRKSVSVLYGSLTFFTTIIHNTFLIYHIDYYLSVVKINLWAFWAIEIVFLIWNSLNDPLFGWISDKGLLNSSGKTTSRFVVIHRIRGLSWAYPLLAVSFLLFWLPLPLKFAAVQLLVALTLYDTALTTIELHYTSLLVDLTTSTADRADLNFYSALFSCFGASTIFISYTLWDPGNPTLFCWYCAVVAVISLAGYLTVIPMLKTSLYIRDEDDGQVANHNNSEHEKEPSAFAFLKQLSKNGNFFWFSAMSFIQVLHCHFNSSFFPLILDSLLKTGANATLGSALLALSFIAPHFNNLWLTHLCKFHGTYQVVRVLFYLKLIFPILLLACGLDCTVLLVLFVACNRIFTEGLCKVLNLVLSELVDEDCVMFRRPHPVAALISGTVSLVTKPGQTLAPIIGTALISYLSSVSTPDHHASVSLHDTVEMSGSHSPTSAMSQSAIFYTIVWVPIVCAALQVFMWTQYKLRDGRLKMIQHLRNAKAETGITSSVLSYLPL